MPMNSANPAASLLVDGVRADPYDYYEHLRDSAPIHWDSAWSGWIITRYKDVYDCLRDDRLSASRNLDVGHGDPATAEHMREMFTNWLVFSDPPLHTRLRSALKPPFAPARIDGLTPKVREYVEGLVDAIDTTSEFDFVACFARPLTAAVISHVLGVPDEHIERFTAWADDVARVAHSSAERGDRIFGGYRALWQYLEQLVREAATEPTDSFLSQLTHETDLTESEIVASGVMLLVGGIDTTRNQLGNTLIAISRAPGLWAALRRDPSLIPATIEEAVRYEGASRATVRIVSESHYRDGVKLNAGEKVMLVLGAANADPEHFADPRKVDPDRSEKRHVGFGFGRHFCIGAPLARMELRVAFERLTVRFAACTIVEPELSLGES